MRLRDLLAKLMWDPRENFEDTTIRYLDRRSAGRRGSVADLANIKGREVLELGKGYLVIRRGEEVSHIPLHRVREVISPGGETMWSREG